jgi:hypothetical protein
VPRLHPPPLSLTAEAQTALWKYFGGDGAEQVEDVLDLFGTLAAELQSLTKADKIEK